MLHYSITPTIDTNMNTKKAAIHRRVRYSGETRFRLLLSHPHVELVAVTSRQYAGQRSRQVLPQICEPDRSRKTLALHRGRTPN